MGISKYNTDERDLSVDESLNNVPKTNVVWDDIVNSLIAQNLESTLGTVDNDFNENAIVMQSGGNIATANDRLIFNLQKPHAMCNTAPNNTMNLHIHWEQVNSNVIQYAVQYRIQNNGQAKTTAWTTVIRTSAANSVYTYVSGTLNQITRLAEIDLSASGISATLQFRICRTDTTGGDIRATFIDAHVPFDQLGSRSEYVK